MYSLAEIIGWKFNHQQGMSTIRHEDGTEEITAFPGGIPTQQEIDTWTAEYDAYVLAGGRDTERAIGYITEHPAVAALLEELEKLPQMQGLRSRVIANLKGKV